MRARVLGQHETGTKLYKTLKRLSTRLIRTRHVSDLQPLALRLHCKSDTDMLDRLFDIRRNEVAYLFIVSPVWWCSGLIFAITV